MNFPGNILQTTLDLLSTISHQEFKAIEAALSLSKSSAATPATGTTKFNYFDNCPTPPTWSSETNSTTTTIASLADFEELDIAMNNLPKLPAVGGVAAGPPNTSGGAGGPAPHTNQFAEYLEMQQRAQNLHQQQTQAQNQALAQAAAAAAAASGGQPQPGHYLANRPFVGAPSVSGLPPGPGIPPPLAVMSHAAPVAQSQSQPPSGHHPHSQAPHAQRQPLALTSNATRAVDQAPPQQSVPSAGPPATAAPINNNNNQAISTPASSGPGGNVQTVSEY